MGREERDFYHESMQDGDSIAAYLRALTQGVAQGRIQLTDGGGQIVLRPSGLVRFQVEATKKRNRVKMTLRLEWSEEPPPPAVADPLTISTPTDE
jgi:amphi-Trp domain-containing protein